MQFYEIRYVRVYIFVAKGKQLITLVESYRIYFELTSIVVDFFAMLLGLQSLDLRTHCWDWFSVIQAIASVRFEVVVLIEKQASFYFIALLSGKYVHRMKCSHHCFAFVARLICIQHNLKDVTVHRFSFVWDRIGTAIVNQGNKSIVNLHPPMFSSKLSVRLMDLRRH